MAPRRKPAAPTYAQLFGDGSGTSSSGPSSSDAVPDSQTSHRVSPSPPFPPQMPPPPPPAAAPQPIPEGAVRQNLRVPSYAPFARYTFIGSIRKICGGGFACSAWTGGFGCSRPRYTPRNLLPHLSFQSETVLQRRIFAFETNSAFTLSVIPKDQCHFY
uniref:Uncharacterized protein n=1 Tax=Brassica oleracea var. oleracea TaxID=109376 RepID=A0A0D3E9Z9_BRAOL